MHARFPLSLLAGLLLATGAGLLATPSGAGAVSQPFKLAVIPLPACRYGDRATRHRQPSEWRTTLVDTERKVTRTYVPASLVSVRRANLPGTGVVRSTVIADLKAMALAARHAGAAIAVRSAYRSYAQQVATFQMWVDQGGYQQALRTSARPGHSEHQLGTSIDFRSANSTRPPWAYGDWAQTSAGSWMKANAWRYGFLMSYPKGKSGTSCYDYEPWHYRYYGRALSAAIHQVHQVPRRYLWNHFETAP